MTARRRLALALFRSIYLAGLPFSDGGITILSYHSLDNLGTPLSVSPHLFAAQMATLESQGCTTFTMSQVAHNLLAHKRFPRRAVAITFDDGFASMVDVALPILNSHHFTATSYIITGMIGRRTLWTDGGTQLPSLPLLSWQQIEAAHNAGIEIGAHSVTHGFLTQYSDDQLRDELLIPKTTLQERLKVDVSAFAYPQGDYDERVVRAVHAAGYTTAATVDQGRTTLASDLLLLPRLLVSNNTTPTIIRAFVSPSSGPAYRLINFVVKKVMGRQKWPRREPGEVDSTVSAPLEGAEP